MEIEVDLEGRCRRADVEGWRLSALELWRSVVGGGTGRLGGMGV